jgi:hypothetical protein
VSDFLLDLYRALEYQGGMLIPFRKGCDDAERVEGFLKAVCLKPFERNPFVDHDVRGMGG